MNNLTVDNVIREANIFSQIESTHSEPSLYGVTDGKAVGTYLEHKFIRYLENKYFFEKGNSAVGIDIPGVEIDIKVTSIKQPQSSCPFRSAEQKIYGLGYHLLVFVYDKVDDPLTETANLNIRHTIFIHKHRTADFQTTKGIRDILDRDGNEDDIIAFIYERNLPVDEIGVQHLAERIIQYPPTIGYLTISNALQWRLQYKRVIDVAGDIDGVMRVY